MVGMEESDQQNVELVRKYSKGTRTVVNKIYIYWVVVCVVAAAAVYGTITVSYQAGYALGAKNFNREVSLLSAGVSNSTQPIDLPAEVNFGPFWDAWFLLEKHFVNEANGTTTDFASSTDQDRVWGAISGLASSYSDPFTTFLPPEENEFFAADISGEFTGVGMEIGNRNQYLTVISPIPGTPAARSGIKPRDIISNIDGTDSLRMPVETAVKLIRGPKNTQVQLTVLRQGESDPLEITIERELINIPTIQTEIIDDVFVIKLFSFTSKSPRLFRDALVEFAQSGNTKLILDLRGNPGGFLEASIDIASRFLDKQSVVVREERTGEETSTTHYSKGYDHFRDTIRTVVLIDGGSASASEIVAGALRDHNRALVVGAQSFGKGSVQELFPLTKDTALKITIAKWLTPLGTSISAEGIVPDISFTEPETDENYQATYAQDLSQDWQIQEAMHIISRPDFASLLDEIPQELLNKYNQS